MADVITTTGRMRRLVDGWAARIITIGPFMDATYLDGIKALRDQLLDSLDVGEFGDPDQRDVLEDARKFCISHCPETETDGPGRATRCITCPLKYHALTRYEETIDELVRDAKQSNRSDDDA